MAKTVRVKHNMPVIVTNIPSPNTDADHNSIRRLIVEEKSRFKKPTRA